MPLAAWPVAQTTAQYQRAGRHLPGCTAHPGKMLPELARCIVTEYSSAGQVVLDPLAGIGTTVVEQVRKARSRGLPRLVTADKDLLVWRSR